MNQSHIRRQPVRIRENEPTTPISDLYAEINYRDDFDSANTSTVQHLINKSSHKKMTNPFQRLNNDKNSETSYEYEKLDSDSSTNVFTTRFWTSLRLSNYDFFFLVVDTVLLFVAAHN